MNSKWEICRVGDVAAVNPKTEGINADAPFITMSDVQEWGRWAIPSGPKGQRGGIRAKGGDVLVARITPCLENGKIAQVPPHLGGVGGSTEFIVLRGNEVVLSEYLYLWASQRSSHQGAIGLMTGSTGRQRVSARDYADLPIALPPLAEQRRIVDLIGALDDTIEAADEAQTNKILVRDRIANEAYEKGISGGSQMSTLLDFLGESGFVQTGPFGSQLHSHDYVDVGTPVVMPTNIKGGRIDLDGIARIASNDVERLKKHIVRAGDIVWSRRGDVTRFARINEDDPTMICGTGCLLVRPETLETTEWLSVWLSSGKMQDLIQDRAVGATMLNLNTNILGDLPVAVPGEKSRLPAILSSLGNTISAEQAKMDSLSALRSELLTSLLSGVHEIPESYDDVLSA